MPNPVEQKVDHAEEARALLKEAAEMDWDNPGTSPRYREAQAHAQIAIAEQLQGIGEALSGRVEGRYERALEEIAGLVLDEGERDDNKVRERVFYIASSALEAKGA